MTQERFSHSFAPTPLTTHEQRRTRREASRAIDIRAFGQMLKHVRISRGVTQEALLERLDHQFAGDPEAAVKPSWFGHDAAWVSRLEAGKIAFLDRSLITHLGIALDCTDEERWALFVAAGLLPVVGEPIGEPRRMFDRCVQIAQRIVPLLTPAAPAVTLHTGVSPGRVQECSEGEAQPLGYGWRRVAA